METFNQFVTWLNDNETALSAFAALVVIIGVTLSPMGSGLRRALSRSAQDIQIDKTMAPGADQLNGQSNHQDHNNGAASLSDKPSVAVLPFENLSGDAEQAYFSEGIAEDIIVALSKLHSLFVIARNTSFAYKELSGQGNNLGKALGARYIVQGSVRKMGERARINAQLIDTETDEQLWAERFDRDLDDVFLIQDEITAKVISILPSRIEAADLKRTHNKPTHNLKAYEYLLRGKYHHHLRTQSDNAMAYELLSQAVEADPNSAQAFAWRACVIGQALFRGYRDDEAATEEILKDLRAALALDDEDFECHRVFSGVYTIQQNYDRALFHAQRAFELNPNDPRVISQYGELLVLIGDAEAGIEMQQQALLVDPYSPDDRLTHLGFAQFSARRYQDAVATFKKISSLGAKHHAYLAACYAQLNDAVSAEQQAAEVLRMEPGFSAEEFVAQLQYKNDADAQHHLEALRLAGL
ncbi:MAG: hypothetical protein KUG71_10715 [Porticoccaceae bacterium]|nr:hypothetical protein [Porticoccaceae bacterium]